MYKVCFVLPGIGRYPVGGYKMTYEYANRLVAVGKIYLHKRIDSVDIQAQVNNVVRIFEDIDLKNSISSNGIESANKYSWEEAMNKFNKVIGYIQLKQLKKGCELDGDKID
ncbi:hypothetical protein BTI95_04225 [Lactobacillus delbrueckii subsp. bulgaricus]|nr:hypothetical protein [Lactobacillus delbrueckii subsp. bulgaricus]